MLQDVQPLALILPLYEKTHVIQDREGDIWMFREHSSDGSYPRYTLKGEMLSQGGGQHKAHLFGAFQCDQAKRIVSVFLEDIVVGKQGVHLGTWMVNRLIMLIRQAGRAIEFREIYGYLSSRDEQRARAFFERFNFRWEIMPDDRERIFCPADNIRIVLENTVKEIGYREIVCEWYEARAAAKQPK